MKRNRKLRRLHQVRSQLWVSRELDSQRAAPRGSSHLIAIDTSLALSASNASTAIDMTRTISASDPHIALTRVPPSRSFRLSIASCDHTLGTRYERLPADVDHTFASQRTARDTAGRT